MSQVSGPWGLNPFYRTMTITKENDSAVVVADPSMFEDPFAVKDAHVKSAVLALSSTIVLVAAIALTILAATGQLSFASSFASAIAASPGAIAGVAIGLTALALAACYTGYKAAKTIHQIKTYDKLATSPTGHFYEFSVNPVTKMHEENLPLAQNRALDNLDNRVMKWNTIDQGGCLDLSDLYKQAHMDWKARWGFVKDTLEHYKLAKFDCRKITYFTRHLYACNFKQFAASKISTYNHEIKKPSPLK